MAYGGSLRQKDNFGRFQKQATINLKKHLQKEALEKKIDAQSIIADKLLSTYKDNVEKSFIPRSQHSTNVAEYNKYQKKQQSKDPQQKRRHRITPPYKHTGTLLEAIGVKIEDDKVKIVIEPKPYKDSEGRVDKNGKQHTVTAVDIHEFLTEGTRGGGGYKFIGRDGQEHWAINHPTPIHEFEVWTQLDMKGFLETLNLNDYARKRRYKKK